MNKTNKPPVKLLLVASGKGFYNLINHLISEFEETPCQLDWIKSYQKGLQAMSSQDYDVCLVDYSIKNQSGVLLTREAVAAGCRASVVLLTEKPDEQMYLEAAQAGAALCLTKEEIDASFVERAVNCSLRETESAKDYNENIFDFRHLAETLPLMIYAAEPQPPYAPIYTSPSFKTFGYPLSEWRKSADLWVKVIHPDDRDKILQETEKAMKSGAEVDFEYRVIAQDKTEHWVRDRGCFIRDEAGNVVCWQGIMLDITKEKQAEQELQKREKLYRTLAKSIPHTAVALFDRDFRFTLADGVLLNKQSFSPEMFEGKKLSEVFPPEISREWADYFRRALTGETVSLEDESQESCFQIYVVPVKDEGGEIFAGMLMWQDITQRKNAEKALRESEARFKSAFEDVAVGMTITSLDGRWLQVNQSLCKMLGYAKEEFAFLSFADLTHPEDLPANLDAMLRLSRGEISVYQCEKRYFHKQGHTVWIYLNVSLVRDAQGEPLHFIAEMQDITERKRAEEALKESEARYRNLFENANDLIYVHDLRGRFLSINQTAERVFGYTREQAVQMGIQQITAPEHLEFSRRMLAKKIAGAKQTGYEIDCFTKSGERLTLEVNSTAIEKDGVTVAIQGIARDITERKRTEAALRESEERYRDLFENANDLIYTHDLDGNFTSLNRAGEIVTGYTREEVLRMNVSQIVAPEFLESAREMISHKLVENNPTAYELEIISKNGERVSLELSTRIIYQNEVPVGVQGIARDITERKRAEKSLVNSERRYRSLGEGIMHQVWTTTADGKLDYANRRTLDYFGRSLERTLDEGWQDAIHPEDLPECLKRWAYSLETGKNFETELRLKRYDGVYRWHKVRATAALDADGNVVNWFGTNTDIDDKKLAEAKLNYNALHDGLTNLPNRIKFMNHLKRAVRRSESDSAFKFAVLFLDLDRFKIINDSLGHSIGDKLLIALAERLESCIRPGDIVARLGGDEFTVLLNNITGVIDAVRVADRLLKELSAPFKLDAYEVFTSASIGIIVSDEVKRLPEDFLRDADTAMYRAKEAGKSRYEIFDREMHIRNMNLLQLENDLRRAIEQKEFRVYYQPLVELETGEIREFEALIRWQHPAHGLVEPKDFIGIAEETGLIIPIGRWILEESCRQISEWQKRFPQNERLSISVNLSAKQLMHPSLIAQVGEILTQTALDPRALKLEVTESMVMGNCDKALSVISALRARGISLSTDDFGTGYSSLSYLHRFPFDRLKVDRSFVGKMDVDQKSEAIVRTILLLGQNLNIEVVAEGIENESQLVNLRRLGCKTGQGFLFSKPVPAERAEQFLEYGIQNETVSSFYDFSNAENHQLLELDKIH